MWGLGEEAFGIGEQCHLTLARAPQAHRRMNVLDERAENLRGS